MRRAVAALSAPPAPSPDAQPPSLAARGVAAALVGVAAGLFCWMLLRRPGYVPDFAYPWTGARWLVAGHDPYAVMAHGGGRPPYNEPLYYPLTTLLLVAPLTRLAVAAAGGLLFGVASAALAFAVTREGLWRLHLFASGPFVMAATQGQFSPLVTVAALVPACGFLATVKPNIGLAALAYRPSWRAALGCAVVLAVSLLVQPDWIGGWLANMGREQAAGVHAAPVRHAGGLLLLLAAVKWRDPRGRLLLAMSLVPQALFFYDQLALWLVPRTRRESIVLTAMSQAALLAYYVNLRRGGVLIVESAYPFVMWLVYVPALVILLRKLETGPGPSGPGPERRVDGSR